MANSTTRKQSQKSKLSTWGWIWRLVVSLAIPLAVGGVAAIIAGDAMKTFGQFNQPPLAPPAWLFPVAWTVLYILMGLACFFVWTSPLTRQLTASNKKFFFVIYGIQLVFNFFWSILFFNLEWHIFAFIWLIAMWLMILALIIWGRRNRPVVMWLLLPYILWVTFAGYLNLMIAILN